MTFPTTEELRALLIPHAEAQTTAGAVARAIVNGTPSSPPYFLSATAAARACSNLAAMLAHPKIRNWKVREARVALDPEVRDQVSRMAALLGNEYDRVAFENGCACD